MVCGRFVNGFIRNDWVLGFLYRSVSIGLIAGLQPIRLSDSSDAPTPLDSPPTNFNIPVATSSVSSNLPSPPPLNEYSPLNNPSTNQTPIFSNPFVLSSGNSSIENVDLGSTLGGHLGYRDPEKMRLAFEKCGLLLDESLVDSIVV